MIQGRGFEAGQYAPGAVRWRLRSVFHVLTVFVSPCTCCQAHTCTAGCVHGGAYPNSQGSTFVEGMITSRDMQTYAHGHASTHMHVLANACMRTHAPVRVLTFKHVCTQTNMFLHAHAQLPACTCPCSSHHLRGSSTAVKQQAHASVVGPGGCRDHCQPSQQSAASEAARVPQPARS